MANRLLVIGGTAFVGRAATEEALRRGYEVTLFHRGQTGKDLFPEAEHILGDRDGGLGALANGTWDAVLDSSGYVPRTVRDSAQLLAPRVGAYLFVSSLVIYGDLLNQTAQKVDETSPLAPDPDPDTTSEDPLEGDNYGRFKKVCEREIAEAFPGRWATFRCGSIIGPHDSVGPWGAGPFARLIARMAQGGDVVVPGYPEQLMQFIDARDLGSFMLDCLEAEKFDVFNTVGPTYTRREWIGHQVDVTGNTARPVWCDDKLLGGIEGCFPWFSPLTWVPDGTGPMAGIAGAFDNSKVVKAGMTFRPLRDTIQDTYDTWIAEGKPAFEPEFFGAALEQKVLAAAG